MTAPLATPTPDHNLQDWLSYIESIHHRPIEMGLERIGEVARRMKLAFSMPVITVGGTNGKGSTCAMMESMYVQAGYQVGLHTSPHLLSFNERCRINQVPVSDAQLIQAFTRVQEARDEISLTYHEFTTLAILHLMATSALDIVILEVGLGGRLDAVNIVDADVSIITSVDMDHMEYLGDTREKIGFEKAHIFRKGRPAIVSDPVPPHTVLDYADYIEADLRLFGRDFNYSGDKQQWSWGGRAQRRNALAYPALRGSNQLLNASAALAALEALHERLPVPAQAVRQGLMLVNWPGRFQVLAGQPVVILDVAHNPHAAAVLAQNLDQMGFFPFTHAVFAALKDKDVPGMLHKLMDKIDHWYLPQLQGPRAMSVEELHAALLSAGYRDDGEKSINVFEQEQTGVDTVAQALAAAQEAAQQADRIIVFGSFLTVTAAMKALGPRALSQ